jgi:hypothetical protein
MVQAVQAALPHNGQKEEWVPVNPKQRVTDTRPHRHDLASVLQASRQIPQETALVASMAWETTSVTNASTPRTQSPAMLTISVVMVTQVVPIAICVPQEAIVPITKLLIVQADMELHKVDTWMNPREPDLVTSQMLVKRSTAPTCSPLIASTQ